jgi:hypothetical protein
MLVSVVDSFFGRKFQRRKKAHAADRAEAIHRARGWDAPHRARPPPLLFISLIEGSGGQSSRCGVVRVLWPMSTLEEGGGGRAARRWRRL